MLASKIEDFSKLWPSKRPSKFHRFLHRFFIDFGSVLASNLGPSWGPRRPKLPPKTPAVRPKIWDARFLIVVCVIGPPGRWGTPVLGPPGRWVTPFFLDFKPNFGLTLGMFSAALAGGATPPQTLPLLTGFRHSWPGH